MGQSEIITPNVMGGTLPYAYSWTRQGRHFPGGDLNTLNYISLTPGVETVNVVVTDSTGATAMRSILVTTNPKPTITITPSSTSINTGGNVTFTNTTIGGTLPYLFYYSLNSTSGVTITGNELTFANAGVYTVVESVVDNVGIIANTIPVAITVTAPLPPPAAPSGGHASTAGGIAGSGGSGVPIITPPATTIATTTVPAITTTIPTTVTTSIVPATPTTTVPIPPPSGISGSNGISKSNSSSSTPPASKNTNLIVAAIVIIAIILCLAYYAYHKKNKKVPVAPA
jgi:hypothetical protein